MTSSGKTNGEAVVGLRDLKQAVGSHFFVWSMLERNLKQALSELDVEGREKPVHGISRSLEQWRQLHEAATNGNPEHLELIDEVLAVIRSGLDMRNRIAHGIWGFDARGGTASDVFIRTELNGVRKKITFAELELTNNRLGYIGSHIDRLTSAAIINEASSASNILAEVRQRLRSD